VALVPVGLFAITMMTSANGYVQSTTDPVMRGRVMALYMAIFMGGTPIGAPLVGWVANVAGPRWSMGVAAASGVLAALIGLVWIVRARQLRIHFDRRARGLHHFRLESRAAGPGSAGSGVQAGDGPDGVTRAAQDSATKAGGAARESNPDDAVGR
jgi:MFS family permease